MRALRLARGKTQADLAGNDFTKGFISLVETGRTRISVRAAEILAVRLGVPLALLLPDAMLARGVPNVSDLLTHALASARELEAQGRRAQREIKDALAAWERLRRRGEEIEHDLSDSAASR